MARTRLSEGLDRNSPWNINRTAQQPTRQPVMQPTVTTPAAVDPNAWASNYSSFDQYAASVKSDAALGQTPANPMPTERVATPNSAGTLFQDPFGTGRSMSRTEYSDLEKQMKMIHAPTTYEKGRQFGQNMLAFATGAPSPAPMSMQMMMGDGSEPPDAIMREDPDSVPPEIRNEWNVQAKKIQNQFVNATTRSSGDMTWKDIEDISNNLIAKNGMHAGMIKDLSEQFAKGNSRLARQHEARVLESNTKARGSDSFQKLPEQEQQRIMDLTDLADQGFINASMASEFGLVEGGDTLNMPVGATAGSEGKKGQWGRFDANGAFEVVTPKEIANQYRRRSGIAKAEDTTEQASQIIGKAEKRNANGEKVTNTIQYDNGLLVTIEKTQQGANSNTRNVHELIAELRTKAEQEKNEKNKQAHLTSATRLEQDFGLVEASATPQTPAAVAAPPIDIAGMPEDFAKEQTEIIGSSLPDKHFGQGPIPTRRETHIEEATKDIRKELWKKMDLGHRGLDIYTSKLESSIAEKFDITIEQATAFVQKQIEEDEPVRFSKKIQPELLKIYNERLKKEAEEKKKKENIKLTKLSILEELGQTELEQ